MNDEEKESMRRVRLQRGQHIGADLENENFLQWPLIFKKLAKVGKKLQIEASHLQRLEG